MCTIFFVISDRRTINLEINKTGLSCIIYILILTEKLELIICFPKVLYQLKF